MNRKISCPQCGNEMVQQKAVLMDKEIGAWVCSRCEEAIYDFSGRGESCTSCSSCTSCLWW